MTADVRLIEKYIEQNPSKPGLVNARISGYYVSVSALIAYLEAVHGDVVQTARDYDLPEEAVMAAVAYYRRHKDLFDAYAAATVE